MPFEIGNTHAGKARLFDGAMRRAIAADDGKRLRQAADQLLNKAAEGEAWAINMLADRLDGKVAHQDGGNVQINLVPPALIQAAAALLSQQHIYNDSVTIPLSVDNQQDTDNPLDDSHSEQSLTDDNSTGE